MNKLVLLAMGILIAMALLGCSGNDTGNGSTPNESKTPGSGSTITPVSKAEYPKIASWLAKKNEIIASGKPFDLIMTGFVMPDEVEKIKSQNPNAILLAGLSANWIWDNPDWMDFLTTVASYGSDKTYEITDEMYLRNPDGSRCPFGWASDTWGQEEIYAMDPRNPDWVELITSFYKTTLEQPQHDGIIVDMVVEKQWWCPDAISNQEWLDATKSIMSKVQQLNTKNKLIIFNAGKNLCDIDEYSQYFDGYLMENFMGDQLKATFDEGLKAADGDYIVIYAVDTGDTGIKDMNKMRLGLTLSLLNDNTYFAYDFGPRDHGQAWWFPEYDADLGNPLGAYYEKDNAYWREFENGMVVSSPHTDVTVNFDTIHTDVTTGEQSQTFEVGPDDGRIFIIAG
ncbi:MAG: hypothetical protein HOC20_10000 [Chloroflexi bacterium]|jgi:hypothetical protein|nr:hypothetical protein [Chloroflexota bacterium]